MKITRIVAAFALLLSASPALAQSNFVTAGGSQVDGKVMMCLDANGNAEPATAAGTCLGSGGGGGGGAVTNAGTFAVQNTAATPAGSNVIGHVVADTGSTTAVTALPAIPTGSNVIGHVIADTGSTTAVTALPAIPTGSNVIGHVIADTGSTTAVTALPAIPTGSNVIGHVVADTGSTTAVTALPAIPAGANLIGATSGSYFNNVAGSTLTRITGTTAYAANETVCLFTSVTVCAPGTISIANTNTGKGLINRVTLLKSGTSTTNATFIIWLFSAAPVTATPNQFDATSYIGPRAADMPNYIGSANCTTPTVTSDTTVQVWYECALSNPNTGGALDFQALSGSTNINYLISVTAAYTPASSETFIPYVSGIY